MRVELEVTAMEHQTLRCGDSADQTARNRVSDGQELDTERADLHGLVVGDFDEFGAPHDITLVAAITDQAQCESRTIDRELQAAIEHLGDSANVVLVAVRNQTADDLVFTLK